MSDVEMYDEDLDSTGLGLCEGCSVDDGELAIECSQCWNTFALCQECFDYRCPCPHCSVGKGEEHDYFEVVDRLDSDEDEDAPDLDATVGLFQVDENKPTGDEFLARIHLLMTGIESLTSKDGLPEDVFEQRVHEVDAVYTEITTMLGRSAPIKGANTYRNEKLDVGPTGLYGFIRDQDPNLLHAAYVLRACHQYLREKKKKSSQAYPPAPRVLSPCPLRQEVEEKARAGRVLVRVFKKHLAYNAIWAGEKWTSAKLAENLGVKKPKQKKVDLDKAKRQTNPIQTLSGQNIERLKQNLYENAQAMFGLDLRALRKEQIKAAAQKVAEQRDATHKEFLNAQATYANMEHQLGQNPLLHTQDNLQAFHATGQQRTALLEKLERLQAHHEQLKKDFDDQPSQRQMGVMPDEFELFSAVLNLPFTIKHATPNWYCIANDGSLDSLMEFQKKNPDWKSEFSTPGNVSKLGNHGFVFFRVDVGYDAIVTRYGGTQVMDDLSVLETDGWISLFDQLKPLSSKTIECSRDHKGALIRHAKMSGTNNSVHEYEYGYIPPKVSAKGTLPAISFSASNLKSFKSVGAQRFKELDRKENFIHFVFYGPQIRLGIALSLLYELRFLHRCGYRDHLLKGFSALTSPEDRALFLKQLIGQFFRPEGKYPVALRFTEHPVNDMSVVNPEGDKRWQKDGMPHPDVMNDVKVIQKRKFLSEALPQARKTYYFHKKKVDELEAEDDEVLDLAMLEDQKRKMQARKAEWDRYEKEVPIIEKAFNAVKQRNPWLIVDESAPGPASGSAGLSLQQFLKKTESSRKSHSILLPSRGTLERNDADQPTTVRYGFGRTYAVQAVPDAGNCFYECCAVFLKNVATHQQLRQRLSGSPHLANSERVRVGKAGEYATIEDITAMAKELNLTICVHQCSYASSKVVPHIVHTGAAGEMHVLFLYNPVDGLGHIMPMVPQG